MLLVRYTRAICLLLGCLSAVLMGMFFKLGLNRYFYLSFPKTVWWLWTMLHSINVKQSLRCWNSMDIMFCGYRHTVLIWIQLKQRGRTLKLGVGNYGWMMWLSCFGGVLKSKFINYSVFNRALLVGEMLASCRHAISRFSGCLLCFKKAAWKSIQRVSGCLIPLTLLRLFRQLHPLIAPPNQHHPQRKQRRQHRPKHQINQHASHALRILRDGKHKRYENIAD